MNFAQAKAEIAALGDEAHYEGAPRMLTVEAAALIDDFTTVAQRCTLRLEFFDAFDKAADRQINFDSLGVPMELRA